MVQFEKGTKVRVNEGLLEGQTGVVENSNEHLTMLTLNDVAFGGGPLVFYTQTLVSADEPHEALKTVKLYPDLLNSKDYMFRLTTFVDGIMYQSIPVDGPLLLDILKTPPAGLHEVEAKLKGGASRAETWKMLWSE